MFALCSWWLSQAPSNPECLLAESQDANGRWCQPFFLSLKPQQKYLSELCPPMHLSPLGPVALLLSITRKKALCCQGNSHPSIPHSAATTTKTFMRACQPVPLCETLHKPEPWDWISSLRSFSTRLLFGFINLTTRRARGTCPVNSRSVALGTKNGVYYHYKSKAVC